MVYISIKRFSNRKCLKIKVFITEITHEISPICDFLFGSIRTNLMMDTVDIELTVQMLKAIYMYRKDHTAESMTFTPWSKKVTPFPSLRHKNQASKVTREVREYCHGVMPIHFNSLPLPWCKITQEREHLAKSGG